MRIQLADNFFLAGLCRACRWRGRGWQTSLLCGLLLLTGAASLNAETAAKAKTGSLEKIHIESDHMTHNIPTGNSVYTGNVRITQGELDLRGDRVTLTHSNNELQLLTVTGKPARYNHVTETGETIVAESEQMQYIAAESRLILTINASLKQPDHLVTSQKIIYDTRNKIVIAGDKPSRNGAPGTADGTGTEAGNGQRVSITLTPKAKTDTDKTGNGKKRKKREKRLRDKTDTPREPEN